MKKSFFVLVLSTVVVCSSLSPSHSQWKTIQLTDNSYDDRVPQINDYSQVVWRGHDGTSTVQLTDNSYPDDFPQINNSGYVVWQGHDGLDSEFFLYDGTDLEIFLARPSRLYVDFGISGL